MNALLRSLITFLYPAQCRHCGENLDPADGHYICKPCWQEAGLIDRPYCEICGYSISQTVAMPERISSCIECPESPQFRKARSAAVHDSAVGEAVRLLKYQGKAVMAKPLADLMLNALPSFFGMEDYDCIVPVPIHKKKRRERGYNQMELIGKELSSAVGIPLETRSLIKIRHTESQRRMPTSKDRATNVRGAFDVTDPSRVTGKKILLIDDVLTTGATANESAKTLARKGKARYVDVFTLTRRMRT